MMAASSVVSKTSNTTQTTMFKLVVLLSVVAFAAAKPGFLAPVAYSAAIPATSSVSQYSSSVVHGSPVASVVPAVYSAPLVAHAPVIAHAPVAWSQAPKSPAVVLDAINGVPLDTPEVVAARAAHFQAKALSGYHHLKKRSVAAYGVAPVAYSAIASPVAYSSPLVSSYSAPLVSTYSAPLAYSSPAVYPSDYSVHPW